MTTPAEIIVRGHHHESVPPDRGTIHVTIRRTGEPDEDVFAQVAESAEQLTAEIRFLHHSADGPIVDWTADSLRHGTRERWTRKGKRLPDESYASVDYEIEFSDFTSLNEFTGTIAQIEGTSIQRTSWSISDETREAAEAAVRRGAARDARRHAQDYADALELGRVRPIAVGEPGLLRLAQGRSDGPEHGDDPSDGLMRPLGAPPGLGAEPTPPPHIDQAPIDVDLYGTVEARFVAE